VRLFHTLVLLRRFFFRLSSVRFSQLPSLLGDRILWCCSPAGDALPLTALRDARPRVPQTMVRAASIAEQHQRLHCVGNIMHALTIGATGDVLGFT
jgi:hypothetical protein